MIFYKLIDESTIQPAPTYLKSTKVINGIKVSCLCLSNSEKVYNEHGYQRVEVEPYPEDAEYTYKPYYELADNVIVQRWKKAEKLDIAEPSDPTTEFMETLSKTETNSIAKIRAAAQAYLNATSEVSE